MATSYLTKTFSGDSDLDKWTLSMWVKRAGIGNANALYGIYINGSNEETIQFRSSDDIIWEDYQSGGTVGKLLTNRLFRDPAAWYHLVFVYDSANVTAGDRMKMYINGVEEGSVGGYATDTNPSSGQDSLIGNTYQQQIGANGQGNNDFEGCMTHIHFCDGYAYAASDFGETDATSGIWKIKTSPSVSYGTNGYFILDNSASVTDASPNSNNWTVYEYVRDTLDNPSNNFCTINPLSYHVTTSLGSLANANTTGTTVSSGHWGVFVPTLGADAGKWYIEGKVAAGADISLGVVSMADAGINASTSWYIGQHTTDTGYQNSGDYYVGGSSTGGWSTFTSGDIMGMALDLDNRKIYFHKNGVYEGSGDPVAGTNGLTVTADDIMGFAFGGYNGGSWNINYGNGHFAATPVSSGNQDDAGEGDFEYDVPAGYYTLCTKNIKAYGG